MFVLVRVYMYIFRYNPCQQFPAFIIWRGRENISSSFRNVFDINPKVSHFAIFSLKCLVAELLLLELFQLLLKWQSVEGVFLLRFVFSLVKKCKEWKRKR